MSDVFDFTTRPVHLGLGATAVPQPEHTGEMEWYVSYGERHGGDGNEGRLVSMHTFTESWDTWEVHPNGDELVACVSGSVTLHQEHPDGTVVVATLEAGQAVVNPPGVWHTADVEQPCQVLFVTAGLGTDVRPR
jgi:uncharacterized cupin superfamily protein